MVSRLRFLLTVHTLRRQILNQRSQPSIRLGGMIKQPMNRLGERIVLVPRHSVGGKSELLGLNLTLPALRIENTRRISHCSSPNRNSLGHHGIGPCVQCDRF